MADDDGDFRRRKVSAARRMTELYDALKQGDQSRVLECYDSDPTLQEKLLTILDDTVLHIAFYFGQDKIAKEILSCIPKEKLIKPNNIGSTILHEAAAIGKTDVVDEILVKAPELLWSRNQHGETPLFRAAHYGQTEMFQLLATLVDKVKHAVLHWIRKEQIISLMRRNDGTTALHIAILAEFFDDGGDFRRRKVSAARRMTELYDALKQGNQSRVLECYDSDPALEEWPLTIVDDTVLHLAFYFGQDEIAKKILSCIPKEKLIKPNNIGNTILHEAAAIGKTDVVDEILGKAPELLWSRNQHGETPLFRAAQYGQTEMFLLLADRENKLKDAISDSKRGKQNIISLMRRNDGATALHIAILAEFFETALTIAERYEVLLDARDERGATGLHLLSTMSSAFKSGSNLSLVKWLIYSCISVPNKEPNVPRGNMDQGWRCSDVENAGSRSPQFGQTRQTNYTYVLPAVFGKIKQVKIWDLLTKEVREEKKKHESAMRLAEFLIKNDTSWMDTGAYRAYRAYSKNDSNTGKNESDAEADDDTISVLPTMTSASNVSVTQQNEGKDQAIIKKPVDLLEMKPRLEAPLLLATSSGIIEIVEKTLKEYPQSEEHVNPSTRQNILHVAVKCRRKKIFDLVTKSSKLMQRLTGRIDNDGNTILHQVAFREAYHDGESPGPAFLMQDQLYWLQVVKKTLPPHYLMHRNNDGLTADQLFVQKHMKLLGEAQEWMKRTSESSSLVSVLIATVAFAAAYTIPGGLDGKTGLPILLNQPFFMVFTVMDVISLASSLTSVVLFLSILTSPFHLKNFHQSLPLKLTLGFTLLLFSIATMMLAFAATVILTINMNKRSITLLLYVIAFFPVSIFVLLQLPLYTNLAASILRKAFPIFSLFPTSTRALVKTH